MRDMMRSSSIWMLAVAIAGAFSGYCDDLVWATGMLGVWFIAGIVLVVAFQLALHRLRKEECRPGIYNLARAAMLGGVLGIFTWLCSLIIWLALQIALGGVVGPPILAILGAATGATIGLAAAWVVRSPSSGQGSRLLLPRGMLLAMLICTGVYLVRTGPRDVSRYPDPRTSPYRLPWKAGDTRLCIQGNNAVVSHRNSEEYAYDFAMPVGTEVCAARAGVVVEMDLSHDGHGFHARNNYIIIDHCDGTFGGYHHLKRNGSLVRMGQYVRSGEPIAASGNVGTTLLPHVHFHVSDRNYNLLPVTFADVQTDGGIPRMFRRYTSGNKLEDDP